MYQLYNEIQDTHWSVFSHGETLMAWDTEPRDYLAHWAGRLPAKQETTNAQLLGR
jgi:hypothetical protein